MSRKSSSGSVSRISLTASAPLAHSPTTETPRSFSSRSRSRWRAGFSSSTMSALIFCMARRLLILVIRDDDFRDDPAAGGFADAEVVGRGVELREALLRVGESDACAFRQLPARRQARPVVHHAQVQAAVIAPGRDLYAARMLRGPVADGVL